MEDFKIKTLSIFLFFVTLVFARDANQSLQMIKAYNDKNIIVKVQEQNASANIEDFNACRLKNTDAFIHVNGVDATVFNDDFAISFNKPKTYINYNPFDNFYTLYTKAKKAKPISQKNLQNNLVVGAIGKNNVSFGKIIKIHDNYLLNFDAQKGDLIVDGCCRVLGVAKSKNSFLTNDELIKAKTRKSPFNGYIGIDYTNNKNGIFVKNVDTKLQHVKFCPNDKIISINDVNISSSNQLNKIILSAQKDSTLRFLVQRSGKNIQIEAKVSQKPNYNLNSISYLESLGIKFSYKLFIKSIQPNSIAQKKGLKLNDKLLQINFKNIKNYEDVRRAIFLNKNKTLQLLFSRNEFQFFVNIDKNDIKGVLSANCPAF